MWSHLSNECGGMQQSPINIDKATVRRNESLQIRFHNYNSPSISYSVLNDGHSGEWTGDIEIGPPIR